MDPINLSTFNVALKAIGATPLADQRAFEDMRALLGDNLLDVMRVASHGGETGTKWLRCYGTAANFLATLYRAGFDRVTYQQAFNVIVAIGQDRVRDVTTSALRGDGTAKRDLSGWLLNAQAVEGTPWLPAAARGSVSGEDAMRAPGPEQGQGHGRTPVLSQHNREMAPPPLAPTGQAYRRDDERANTARAPTPPSNRQEAPRGDRSTHRENTQPQRRQPESRQQTPSAFRERPRQDEERREPSRAPENRCSSPASGDTRTFDTKHAYGGRAALSFEATTTKAGHPTVQIDVATGQNKNYDWSKKLIFQLTTAELQLMCALLYGHIDSLFLSGHDDKWLRAEHQTGAYAGTIKFQLGKGKAADFQPRTVQVSYTDLGEIHSMLIRQTAALLKQNAVMVERLVRQVAHAYSAQLSAKSGGGQGNGGARQQNQDRPRQYA